MDNDEKVVEETLDTPTEEATEQPQEQAETPEISAEELEELKKKAKAYDDQKIRAEKAEAEAKKVKQPIQNQSKQGLDVSEYIEISTALNGLDPVEQARLVKESKLQGVSLNNARKSEDFTLWQNAYKIKVEKEKSLKPSGTQNIEPSEKSFTDKVKEIKDPRDPKLEELLSSKGLYKAPKPRVDVRKIG